MKNIAVYILLNLIYLNSSSFGKNIVIKYTNPKKHMQIKYTNTLISKEYSVAEACVNIIVRAKKTAR